MPEELLVVNFTFINVFGRFMMKLDLADPNFADFRSNSANIMFFFAEHRFWTSEVYRSRGNTLATLGFVFTGLRDVSGL